MFFDDRLATVLRQRAESDTMRRTQFRQLLDLLGSKEMGSHESASQGNGARKTACDPSLVAAAWMRMSKLAETIPSKDRARLITEPGWRLRNPELVAHLTNFEPEVASAALSRAQISSEDWTTLIPRLPVRARGFLRLRRDLPSDVETMLDQLGIYDRGLPQPQSQPQSQPQTADELQAAGADLGSGKDVGEPLDLSSIDELPDELPGANIPADELPDEPLIAAPIGQLSGGTDADEEASSGPMRPIFFPKERTNSSDQEAEVERQEFTPEPFTLEELRDIAPEPLGIGETSPEVDLEDEVLPDTYEDALDREADDTADTVAPDAAPPEPQSTERSEISALVERISTFQRNKEQPQNQRRSSTDLPGDIPTQGERLMPRLPLGEEDAPRVRIVRGFSFVADAAGRIEWAQDDVAPMVVGTRLMAPSRVRSSEPKDSLAVAFARRQPLKSVPFTMNGAPGIAGDWVVDARPRFSQIGGFAGYVGRMRRPIEAAPAQPSAAQREADRIRQLLHELRTPVTAVQGYSEVIQQQLFGSAPHEYRALAAAIASDAARILSGFEELDRLAKLETGALEIDTGRTDIAALTQRFIRQLSQVLDARMAAIELKYDTDETHIAKIDDDSAQSLMWRYLASLGGGCAAGETLQADLSCEGGFVRLCCDLPMQLLGEDDLFAVDARPLATAINPGIFGGGFALRLARAEARTVGGDLVRKGQAITLTLPRTTMEQGKTDSDIAASDS